MMNIETKIAIGDARPCGDGYVVTRDGDVWSSHRDGWHLLAPSVREYRSVNIKRDGRRFRVKNATLVCSAFHGPKPFPEAVIRHLDGDSHNDCADNLAWGTQSENLRDAVRHGTSPAAANGRRGSIKLRGSASHFAKLDWPAVREIRRRRERPEILRTIAADFGVCISTVSLICKGDTWNESAIKDVDKVTVGA